MDDDVQEDFGYFASEEGVSTKLGEETYSSAHFILQKKLHAIVSNEGIDCVSIKLHIKENKPFANCSVCKIDVNLRNARQGPHFVRQHLATQMHKTNAMIDHSRDSNIPIDLAKIQAQIDERFPHIFIHKKTSVVCRGCTKEISLAGSRNVIGNLSQHVGSAAHQQKMTKLESVYSRQITSFFKPARNTPSTDIA